MKMKWKAYAPKIIWLVVIIFALVLRLYGLKWDSGHHLHPDERFLTMVTTDVSIPPSLGNYLDPQVSTLNPYNTKHDFYVYGTFPVTVNKLLASAVDMDSYDGVLLTGRMLSAFAELGVVIMVYLIARRLRKRLDVGEYFPYVAAFLYSITVLAIQHAHFFTVDSFAMLFSMSAFYFSLRFLDTAGWANVVLSALFIGLAGATKASTIFMLPLVAFMFIYGAIKHRKQIGIVWSVGLAVLYAFVAYASLRFADPRIFANASWLSLELNAKFIDNLGQLKILTSRTTVFPPTIQWFSKKPIIFPLQNIVFFGLGVPQFILTIIGAVLIAIAAKKKKLLEIGVILGWVLLIFLYQGTRFALSMRYFYIIYPFFALFAAYGFMKIARKKWHAALIIVLLLIWPLSFMSIYTKPHTRVEASEWIYNNIPKESVIAVEHWDDPLPLPLAPDKLSLNYQFVTLPVFGDDTEAKWDEMNKGLLQAEYYILSSNRGYGSLLSNADKYPRTAQFYTDLFNGNTEFELVAEFTSYPTVPVVGLEFDDQWSEEAFTVYDHPKVSIFKKK